MNDKPSQIPPSAQHAAMDMDELKRDMRNAQLLAWMKKNQSTLIAGAFLLVLAIAGTVVWIERNQSEDKAAAAMYYQSLAVVKPSDKKRLLNALIGRHFGTAYTALAQMQLAHLDEPHAAEHLRAVIANSKSMPEWVWQARLDLAKILLDQGKAVEAKAALKHSVGPAYVQLRQYLLARASSDATTKIDHLKKAQAAKSLDQHLAQRIDSELQGLTAKPTPAPAS